MYAYLKLLGLFLIVVIFAFVAVKIYGRKHPGSERKIIKIYLWAIFIFYLTFLFLLTFGIFRSEPEFILGNGKKIRDYLDNRSNFVPFRTIAGLFKNNASFEAVMVNIVGNIAATAPLGFFLPVLFRRMKKIFPFVIMTTMIVVFIEFTQFAFCIGSCDIDDLILNVAGALLVFFLYHVF
ncbi:MAG: VanZ family protein [Butyrivibrio sp.]|nr:VanZ family protein [Butyrivibrio sp.]